jgi:hypothetical protein
MAYFGHGIEVGTPSAKLPDEELLIRLSENLGSRLVSDLAGARRATTLRIEAMMLVPSVLILMLQLLGVDLLRWTDPRWSNPFGRCDRNYLGCSAVSSLVPTQLCRMRRKTCKQRS